MSATAAPIVDDEAEAATIGACLLATSQIEPLSVEVGLRAEHFYRTAHATVWTAMTALSDDAQPVDVLTVARRCEATSDQPPGGDGWPQFVDRLTGNVPSAGNAAAYARRVLEVWRWEQSRRSHLEALAAVDARDRGALDAAEQAATRLLADGGGEHLTDPRAGAAHMIGWLEEEPERGLPLPWPQLERAPVRLRPGHLTVLGGWTSTGKALECETPIPTPAGWRTMGELQVGDAVFDERGARCTVTAAHGVQVGRPCFAVRFNDGATIIADADHQWTTWTDAARRSQASALRSVAAGRTGLRDQSDLRVRPETVTTRQIRETLTVPSRGERSNHSIPLAGALAYPEQDLTVDPYVLGAWLGDGTSRAPILTSHVDDAGHFAAQFVAAGEQVKLTAVKDRPSIANLRLGTGTRKHDAQWRRRLIKRLRDVGVLGDKHIPETYLRGSISQRLALLQGLMDTDGTVDSRSSRCEFSVTSRALAEGFYELALSLGLRATWAERDAKLYGKVCGRAYRVGFTTTLPVFRLPRKLAGLPQRFNGGRHAHRYIVAVEEVPSRPVRCIEVDSPSRLFLACRELIATHNSAAASTLGAHVGRKGGHVVIWDNELTREERWAREITSQTGVSYNSIVDRDVADRDVHRVVEALRGLPFGVVDAHGWSAMEIARHIRQVRPALAVVDHFHALPGVSRTDEADAAVQALVAAAGQARCHVLLVAQLNQARNDKVGRPAPVLRDLRGTGNLSALPSNVIFVHREEEEVRGDDDRPLGRARMLETGHIDVAKQRGGPPASVPARFDEWRLRWLEETPV